ncbi:MAG: restriction endonuclease subunit S [Phycisphaeraceae bacterium]|nr:restriction endonuclease subunit S [Phycisphaeraceae bacterium]
MATHQGEVTMFKVAREHWEETTIGAVIARDGGSIQTGPFGTKLKAAEYTPDGVPVISVGEVGYGLLRVRDETPRVNDSVTSRMPEYLLREGDIVFGRKGAVDRCARVRRDQDGWFLGSDGIRLRLPDTSDSAYVAYWLQRPRHRNWMLQHAAGTTMPSLNEGIIRRIPIGLPPLNVQRAVAEVLGSLDDKIEHNRRTIRALEGLARAMFKAWFVDFEPVHAKAAGAASFSGMPPEAFAALPTRFTDSDLGPVPDGWEVGRLGEHCGINLRSVRKGELAGEIEYVDISSVKVGQLDGVQRMPFSDAPSRARRRIAHGDTIWSCVRPNHRSYLFIHSPPENRLVSTGFAVLSPGGFGASYLHELTTRQEFVDYLVANADGSAYPAVRPEHFAAAQVLVPPPSVLAGFESMTMPFRDLRASLDDQSRKLAEVRDNMLPKLLSGEVRVGALRSVEQASL